MFTPRRLTLRGVEFFELKFEYLRKNEFFSKTILNCLSGAQVGWIHRIKKRQQSGDTATLITGPTGSQCSGYLTTM